MMRVSWIALLVLVLDQVTKAIAVNMLKGMPPVEVTSFLNLTLVYNTGAAFGMLNNAGGWQNTFFVFVAVAVSMFILVVLRRLAAHDIQVAIALMLILGGALGNVVDRLLLGYVVDFVDFFYDDWHWPAFNVADSAIFVGAVLLALDALGLSFGKPRARKGK